MSEPRGSQKKDRPTITLREMELEDLAEVFALGERFFTAEDWPNLYRTWDEYELVSMFGADGEFCLVAERDDDETLVGFILGTLIEKRRSAWTYGYLVWIGVDPSVRRLGVAKRLTDRLTELFIEQGARMMIVDTDPENDPAVRFFEREGFGSRREHVYFTKNLSQHPHYLRRKAEEASRKGRRGGEPRGRGSEPGRGAVPRGRTSEVGGGSGGTGSGSGGGGGSGGSGGGSGGGGGSGASGSGAGAGGGGGQGRG